MWKCSIGDESDVQIQTAPVSSIRRVDLSLGSFYHWKRPVELCRLSTEYEARGVSSHPGRHRNPSSKIPGGAVLLAVTSQWAHS
jgi:hypothetical protein